MAEKKPKARPVQAYAIVNKFHGIDVTNIAPRLLDRIECRRCGQMVEKDLAAAEGCEDPFCPLT